LIPFTKAHACGNDFLIVSEEDAKADDRAALARRLCARNTGIGADGVEFFRWTGICAGQISLRNADGSTAEISGNGTRCVAAWMALKMDARAGDEMRIVTDAGTRICRIESVGGVGINTIEISTGMGVPQFAPRAVRLQIGEEIAGIQVSIGNPILAFPAEPGSRLARRSVFIPTFRSRPMSSSFAS
jgi:diaminopimelate epimerase